MQYKILECSGYEIATPKVISLDTEYSDLNLRKAKLLRISVGVSPNTTCILGRFEQAQDFIDHADIVFTWNGVVDWYILTQAGFDFPKNKIIDGMLLEHLLDERLKHSLGAFALREYQDNYKSEFWSKYSSYQDAPEDEAYDYEMRDGVYTYRAGVKYLKLLKDKMPLVEHVHRLQWALFDTEIQGIRVNRDLIVKTKEELDAKISAYLPQLRREFSDHCKVWELNKWVENINKLKTEKGKQRVKRPEFSFASDTNLRWLVYDSLETEVVTKTKKGNPATDYETLKTIGEQDPRLKTLVEYKDTKALYSTFVEGMLDRVEDNRIYPGFYINGTATGRISHNNPNMGNLPATGVIRNFFIPDDGNKIVGADYSQLEVVVEANLTEDPNLLKIINEGASKHDITASGLGLSRDQAKTLNFALQYGAGVHKVSKILGISQSEANRVFQEYWRLYDGVRRLKDKTNKELEEKGEVTNLFGRTRHFNKPENEFEKAKQERQAYNFLIQGVGADITNMATYLIAEEFSNKRIGRLWFSVHDEIVTECQDSRLDEGADLIKRCMYEPNHYLNLKYPVQSKGYGPLDFWSKA